MNARLRLGAVAVLVLVALVTGAAHQAGAAATSLVVSQVYGGGGNAGAPLRNDYIEIANKTDAAVDVTGWSVQYAATTGTAWQKTDLTGSIAAGGYYLVQEAAGANTAAPPLPTPDATGAIPMAAGAGKVVLRNSNILITSGTSCPTDAATVDLVGYGTGTNCFEGTGPTGAPSNTLAAFRSGAGCTDTNDNAADFSTAAPVPRNSAAAAQSCQSSPTMTVGTAPLSGAPGSQFTISATVTPGASPDSTGLSVACDLSWANLGANAPLFDAGGNTFSRTVTVPADATTGTKTGGCTVSDDQSRTGGAVYSFDVVPGTTDAAPAVSTHTPAADETGVAVGANIGITFTEPVNVTGSWFSISCATSGSHTATVSGGDASYLLDPDTDFAPNETCTVTLIGAQISDQDSDDPPDTLDGNPSWSFTTAGLAQIVVSQVYGGGGNAGAQYKNDFIELYNRGSAAGSLNGWSVQYASATGTSWAVTPLGNFVLQPGQHYLVQEAAGAGAAPSLPAPDATGTIAMSATSGKVALVNSTTALTSCPSPGAIVDLVGYGATATCAEGTPTANLSNTTAAIRKAGGATDTNDNAADFDVAAPNPRNSGTADNAPGVFSKSPDSGATNVAADANISVSFTEAVDVADGWYTISCATSGSHAAAVTGGPINFTLNPESDFASGESCTVTVFADKISDQDLTDPPDHMDADVSWSFTVTSAPPVAIHDIQAAAHISPLNGTAVSGVHGIVTAVSSSGYWMQDPNPDADPATSEGIFVFTSSRPAAAVGDAVSVSGRVQEFRQGGATSGNLTTTELSGSPVTTVISSGNPLPAATVVGTGGRIPPTQVIEDDASGDVETSGVFDPASDGLDFWESLEGMRIQLNNAVAVGPTNSFGETQVVGDNGDNATSRTARGGVLLRPDDANPERVVADDQLVPLPKLNVGDHYTGPLVGVLDYNFGNFFLEVTSAVDGVHDGVTPESTTPAEPSQISIGTFNFENLAPSDPQSKFDRLASLVVKNLASPDVLSGEEVQDNTGAVDDGTVAADQTLNKLVAAIQAAGGPTYDFREIDPVNDADGGQPGGNIRQVFLFRTDRGLSFVDRPGGTSTAADSVVGTGADTHLAYSPGRVDPTNGAWNASRKPLAGEFMFHGTHLFVIANHFNSKLGDQPLEGHFQPPARSSEVQRHQQAQIVHDFVASILAADPNANVVVDGDLNDFEFSDTVHILENGVLTDLMDTLPLNERYSYVFEGNSQTLDHILMSSALTNRQFTFDPVHVNAEFADQASDHDPSVVRITLNQPPTVSAGGPYSVDEGGSVGLAATGSDPEGGTLTYAWDLDNNGSYETAGKSATFSAAALDGPTSVTVGVQVTDDAGATATDTATINVQNVPPTATFGAPSSAFAGFPFALSLTSPHDPSTADTTAGFTYAFDCGSGYGAFGSAATASCQTSDPGTRSVGGKIRDQNGGVSEYRASVDVVVTFESLCRLVRQVVSDPTIAQSLCDKLTAASSAAARGNGTAKANQLQAFRNQVDGQTGKSISAADATLLKSLSTRL